MAVCPLTSFVFSSPFVPSLSLVQNKMQQPPGVLACLVGAQHPAAGSALGQLLVISRRGPREFPQKVLGALCAWGRACGLDPDRVLKPRVNCTWIAHHLCPSQAGYVLEGSAGPGSSVLG